jgi:hypothetical protein
MQMLWYVGIPDVEPGADAAAAVAEAMMGEQTGRRVREHPRQEGRAEEGFGQGGEGLFSRKAC